MNTFKKNILHIEDDSDFHTYVDALLCDVANVTSVYSVKEADQLIKCSVYDLFLLDLVLRDGSGSNLARKLKDAYPDTPIAILSAHGVTDAINEADANFTKGKVNEGHFVQTIQNLLN